MRAGLLPSNASLLGAPVMRTAASFTSRNAPVAGSWSVIASALRSNNKRNMDSLSMIGGGVTLGLSVHLPCLAESLIIGAQLQSRLPFIRCTNVLIERNHFPGRVVQVKCGEKVRYMITANISVTGNSLTRGKTSRALP